MAIQAYNAPGGGILRGGGLDITVPQGYLGQNPQQLYQAIQQAQAQQNLAMGNTSPMLEALKGQMARASAVPGATGQGGGAAQQVAPFQPTQYQAPSPDQPSPFQQLGSAVGQAGLGALGLGSLGSLLSLGASRGDPSSLFGSTMSSILRAGVPVESATGAIAPTLAGGAPAGAGGGLAGMGLAAAGLPSGLATGIGIAAEVLPLLTGAISSNPDLAAATGTLAKLVGGNIPSAIGGLKNYFEAPSQDWLTFPGRVMNTVRNESGAANTLTRQLLSGVDPNTALANYNASMAAGGVPTTGHAGDVAVGPGTIFAEHGEGYDPTHPGYDPQIAAGGNQALLEALRNGVTDPQQLIAAYKKGAEGPLERFYGNAFGRLGASPQMASEAAALTGGDWARAYQEAIRGGQGVSGTVLVNDPANAGHFVRVQQYNPADPADVAWANKSGLPVLARGASYAAPQPPGSAQATPYTPEPGSYAASPAGQIMSQAYQAAGGTPTTPPEGFVLQPSDYQALIAAQQGHGGGATIGQG